ncbi:MAG: proline dehydrogenase family protein [Nitrospinota bacterium]|nr:proline dehydrogenase family protein [Nitrospinota bacterium]
MENISDLEAEIQNIGTEFYDRLEGGVPGLFDKSFWQGRLFDWAMNEPDFKVDLLRFIDVLPALNSSDKISKHIDEYFLKKGREFSGILDFAMKAASSPLTSGIGSIAIKKGILEFAERFIIGKDPESALKVMGKLYKDGLACTADLLGEATVSQVEAEIYKARYLELIEKLSASVGKWSENSLLSRNSSGSIPVANISLKISALDSQLESADLAGSVSRLKEMALPIFLKAREKNVFVNIDLEQWEYHDITYTLLEEILAHPDMKGWPHIGIVVQAYLKAAEADVERLFTLARVRGTPLTVRLVKGAYWDYEVVHARQLGYKVPVFTEKGATDANYERLTEKLLEFPDLISTAFASHNHRTLLHAMAYAKSKNLPEDAYEVQMIYGMAEPEQKALRKMGKRIRLYAPIGEMLPGIGYLVRRILENTSNAGFLRMSYHEKMDREKLLARPIPSSSTGKTEKMSPEFTNASLTDFTIRDKREEFASWMKETLQHLPIKVPVVVNGKNRLDGESFFHFSPADYETAVTEVVIPNIEEVEKAANTAMASWAPWRDSDIEERATLLEKLADRLDEDRAEISALEVYEVGKPWREADADVAEAIDFCRYYAMMARKELAPRKQGNMAGEINELIYEGRGPTLVVAPWNFPVAILCGMTVAPLVAGNSVIMKPSGKSCATAYALYTRMIDIGFPSEVVQFIPGGGETVGDSLVTHPLIAQIAFTGSKEVGLSILEKASKVSEGQPTIKRVVCEMGGKNAIIVDDDADLDEAVSGIIKSAFGYAGQKCSACSRAIVVGEDTYNALFNRLIEACRSLRILPPSDPGCKLGPVVDESAYVRLNEVISDPGEGAEPLYIGESKLLPKGGYYIPPALFRVKTENHPLMQKELFGPVVAMMVVDDFETAIDVALSTEFMLTGGVFTRSPVNTELARSRFRVGNLYINRGITGALVHRQPFGGFGMSGLGTKAGGPGYLLNFVEPRSISENSMRRGFTPDLDI